MLSSLTFSFALNLNMLVDSVPTFYLKYSMQSCYLHLYLSLGGIPLFIVFSTIAYCIKYNMTVPPRPDTLKKKKKEREKTCCTFVNSPFHVPHLAPASLRPASPHQIEAPRQTHIHFTPEGADSAAHLPCCFYYDSHLSLPPVTHLSSPDRQDMRCHDTRFYRKRVERFLVPSSYHRGYMYCQRLQLSY